MIDVVDLHIHSHYSMATSKNMNLEQISYVAKVKGVTLLATGDITHPLWVKELKEKLTDLKNGLFEFNGIRFVLSGEVNIIFKEEGKVHKMHLLITVPSFKILDKVNDALSKFGNISSDGRPTLFIDGETFVRVLYEISSSINIIPAHIWTPWFGLFGSKSGFDSIEKCFKDQTERIFALETGLSSDPYMNYLIRDIDRFTLISNSDAHSPENIAREANVIKDVLSYKDLFNVIKNADEKRFLFTVEFFPEQGKYFGDGHRKCNMHFIPISSEKKICPVCKKPFTYGVYHRIMEIAHWKKEERKNKKIPFRHVVPLKEVLSEVLHKGKTTKMVLQKYDSIIQCFGSELNVLIFADKEKLFSKLEKDIASAIISMREENVEKKIGYDGIYGQIHLKWREKVELFD